MKESYDFRRFLEAQQWDYPIALAEIRAGKKSSHWIWYIFPQLRALGRSGTANYYGIADLDEARAYLAEPTLRARLEEISAALLEQPGRNPYAVMGSHIDGVKLRSSMTLFALADGREDSVYRRVLEAFFGGREDESTLRILGMPEK